MFTYQNQGNTRTVNGRQMGAAIELNGQMEWSWPASGWAVGLSPSEVSGWPVSSFCLSVAYVVLHSVC
jgi:hypothetical protein